MPTQKAAPITIGEKRWLTKPEAMAWVNRCEPIFDRDFLPYLDRFAGGHGPNFDKRQVDKRQEYLLQMEAQEKYG